MNRYTEPASLKEYKEPVGSKRTLYAFIVVALVFAIGVVGALNLGRLVPTYNGSIDVAALQGDPSSYDLSEADGVAYVIITQDLEKTNGSNVCYSVVFNFRGYDTMGESFILITAVAGCLCILRTSKKTSDVEPVANKKVKNLVTRNAANILLPLACTFGGYIILHGDSSPGGGFQGGVLVAAAVLLIYLAYGKKGMVASFNSHFLHQTETVAEVVYVVLGLIGIFSGAAFATNYLLNSLGMETALFMNHAVGYHVMCGISFLLVALLSTLNVKEED